MTWGRFFRHAQCSQKRELTYRSNLCYSMRVWKTEALESSMQIFLATFVALLIELKAQIL